MIQWPWVPRLVYDTVKEERDRLRIQNAELVSSVLRISRHEAGLPELPRAQRQSKIEPMPKELQEYYAGFFDQKLARAERSSAYRAHMRGKPWPEIVKMVMDEESPPATGS